VSELEKRRITKNKTPKQDYQNLENVINCLFLDKRACYRKSLQKSFDLVVDRLEKKYNFTFESELATEYCKEFANKFLKEAA